MIRSTFKPKARDTVPNKREGEFASYEAPKRSAVMVSGLRATLRVPLPKEGAIQSETYMNLVRAMPCAHCGRPPRSAFCHSDMGKGKGIKTDCRLGWPGCHDDLSRNREGCHTLIGSRGVFTKEQRRTLEAKYAAQTRAAIVAAGKWPPRLPRWEE